MLTLVNICFVQKEIEQDSEGMCACKYEKRTMHKSDVYVALLLE